MMGLDDHVGELLDLLDELGIADNTLVMWATDNGAACNSWPDDGVVTDSARGNVAEHLTSHFVSAEIKHFPAGQIEEARQWT
jgi:arylsulfatase A-like enzyme